MENNKDPKYLGIPNINFSLTNPNDPREDEYSKQRMERGFDDSELWDLCGTLSSFIIPRIKAFRDQLSTIPVGFTQKQWETILDQIILGFENAKNWSNGDTLKQKDYKKIEKGLKLFGKHFLSLWY